MDSLSPPKMRQLFRLANLEGKFTQESPLAGGLLPFLEPTSERIQQITVVYSRAFELPVRPMKCFLWWRFAPPPSFNFTCLSWKLQNPEYIPPSWEYLNKITFQWVQLCRAWGDPPRKEFHRVYWSLFWPERKGLADLIFFSEVTSKLFCSNNRLR